jgi:hypothetical protein
MQRRRSETSRLVFALTLLAGLRLSGQTAELSGVVFDPAKLGTAGLLGSGPEWNYGRARLVTSVMSRDSMCDVAESFRDP